MSCRKWLCSLQGDRRCKCPPQEVVSMMCLLLMQSSILPPSLGSSTRVFEVLTASGQIRSPGHCPGPYQPGTDPKDTAVPVTWNLRSDLGQKWHRGKAILAQVGSQTLRAKTVARTHVTWEAGGRLRKRVRGAHCSDSCLPCELCQLREDEVG